MRKHDIIYPSDLDDSVKGIHIHIPRCGGTTIHNHIGEDGAPHGLLAPRVIGAHSTAQYVIHKIGSKEWEKRFTFAFVRNPWARLASWYKYYQSTFNLESISFKNHIVKRMYLITLCFSVDALSGGNHLSQKTWLCWHDGHILPKFIGRMENFAEDFNHICKELGVTSDGVKRHHTNRGYDYRTYYDDETAAVVAKECEWEIEKFGYEFVEEKL